MQLKQAAHRRSEVGTTVFSVVGEGDRLRELAYVSHKAPGSWDRFKILKSVNPSPSGYNNQATRFYRPPTLSPTWSTGASLQKRGGIKV